MERYVVYGKDNCAFCNNAQAMLKIRDKDFDYLKLEEDYSKDFLVNKFQQDFEVVVKSFPQIIIFDGEKEHYVGGFDNLRDYLNK